MKAIDQLETNKIFHIPTMRHFWKNNEGEVRCSDGASIADKLCDDINDLALLENEIGNDWKVL